MPVLVRFPPQTLETCPQKDKHTPCPSGYVEWSTWAIEMVKTHKQVRCDGCKRFVIWVEKVKKKKKKK